MPNRSVYIRQEDLELWELLDRKADRISKMLKEAAPETQKNTSLSQSENKGSVCCANKVPCKHWKFNGMEVRWENTLTGEVRDAD